MADPSIYVEDLARLPRRGGIKSVVGEFKPLPRLMAAGSIEWNDVGCDLPHPLPGLCWGSAPGGDKEFDGYTDNSTPTFGGYAGVECWLVAGSDYDAQARRQLELGEDRYV